MVDVVVGEAATAFVHAGEIQHPVARQVACDLHVTDEGARRSNLYRSVPRETVIAGERDGEGTSVAPGNIHSPIKGRGRIVVSPTRFAIVAPAIVNAKMGPASSIRGSGGFIPAEALTAAGCVKPDGEPSGGGFVVQSNRVAHGTGKGALTGGSGDTCKARAAIGGDRRARNVDRTGVTASRIVVGYENLIGIIWIDRTECLRLGDVGRRLGASDQINVPGAIGQRHQQLFDEVADGTQSGSGRCGVTGYLAAGHHDGPGPKVFLFVDAHVVDFRTVESDRYRGDPWNK